MRNARSKSTASPYPIRLIAGLAMSCLLLPSRAYAWGKVGHQTVAVIAEDRLNARALSQVHAILGPNVGLADIATCADDIRGRSVKCGGVFHVPKEKYSAAWHFINLPIGQKITAADFPTYCRNGKFKNDCAPFQIRQDLDVLRDPNATRPSKQIALMFLVHFMGDIHQPLHCATDNDAGGNGKNIWLKTEASVWPSNLHHIWDNILEDDASEHQIRPRDLARRLEQEINGKEVSDWLQGDVVTQAALESYRIADDVIYPGYRSNLDPLHREVLGQSYQIEMRPLAYEQIEKAGVRLADLLNETLSR